MFVRLSFYFLRPPRSYSCSGEKCALPALGTTSWSPAEKRMVRRMMNVFGGESGNVTLVPLTRRKENLMKKIGNGLGTREFRSWQTNAKRKKNAIRTRNQRERKRRKKKTKETKKKNMEKKEIYKGRNTPPLHSNIRTNKKKFRLRIFKM